MSKFGYLTLILKISYLYFGIHLVSNHLVYAQDCDGSFNEISESCIIPHQKDFKTLVIPVDEKNSNKIYFFETSNGDIGKIKFDILTTAPRECSIYFNSVSYGAKGIVKNPSTTYSISPLFENWPAKNIYFSDPEKVDFTLKRVGKSCVLTTVNAKAKFIRSSENSPLFPRGARLYIVALFLIALAVFLIAKNIFQEEDRFKNQELLDESGEESKSKVVDTSFVLKVSRPFFKRYTLPIVEGMKQKNKVKEKYKKKLANSGMSKTLSPEEFMAFKLFLILGFPLLFILFRYLLEADWPLMLIPVSGIIGFFYPDIWINGIIDERKRVILLQFPFIVDLLALTVEAGLDTMGAIGRVIEKAPKGPLVDEFEQLIKETRIGASRAEALRQLAWRVDVIAITSFCATIISSDSVGASIGPVLKSLSEDVRQKRMSAVEEAGAKAAGKMLFPLIFLMVPAIIIVVFLPFLGGFFQ